MRNFLILTALILGLFGHYKTQAQRAVNIGAIREFSASQVFRVQSSRIDHSHLLIIYKNGSSSTASDLMAVIAEIDSANKTINYGNPTTVLTDAFRYGTALVLSGTQAVIAYEKDATSDYGEAVTINFNPSTKTITSIGSPSTFDAGDIDAAFSHVPLVLEKLSSTTFAILYADALDDGIIRIGTLTGNTLSFGSAQSFTSGDVQNFWMTALSSSKLLISYENDGASDQGLAIVGKISGDTVSYGSPVIFESSAVSYTAIEAINNSQAAVAYVRDDANDFLYAKVLTVSDSSIAVSTNRYAVETGQDTRDLGIDFLSNGEFAVSFNGGPGDTSKVRIGKISGSGLAASISFSNAVSFLASEADDSRIAAVNENTIVLSYVNDENADEGQSIVGTLAATAIPPTVSISSFNNISCYGDSNGIITATIAAGTPNYNYSWSNGSTTLNSSSRTNTISNLSAGTYTVTVSDNKGLSSSAFHIIAQPTAALNAAVVALAPACFGATDGQVSSSASGGTAPYTYSWSTGATTASISGVPAGTYYVTVSDNKGCTIASATSISEPAPLIAAVAVDSNASCLGFTDGGATVSVNGGTLPYTYSWSNAANSASLKGVSNGSYTVSISDANSCTAIRTIAIGMVDTIKPIVLTQNINSYLDMNGNSSITASDLDNGSSDACGAPSLSLNLSTFDCSNIGTNNVQLIATDINGNIDSSLAIVTVIDTMKPVVITQSHSVYLNAAGQASIASIDVNKGTNDNCGTINLSLSNSNFSCADLGSNTVQLIAQDATGNSDSVSATVTVLDTIKPTIISQNIRIYLDVNGQASIGTIDIDNGSNDICGRPSLTLSKSNFSCADAGQNTIQLIGVDVNNNIDSASSIATVLDSIKPQISNCPVNITQAIDTGKCAAIVTWTAPTAADNCAIDSLVASHNPGDQFKLGATLVSYIAYDAAMNTDTCTFVITISDQENPIISGIPTNINQNNDAGNCDAIVSWTAPTASDNCTLDSLHSNFKPGDVFPVGTTVVSYTAYDAAKNSSAASFNITVIDSKIPVLICPANISQCDSIVSFSDPLPIDNCPGISLIRNDMTGLNSGDEFPIGLTTISYLAIDAHGNQEACNFTVQVYTPPVAHAGPDIETRDIEPVPIQSKATNAARVSWLPFESLNNENIVSPIANPQITTEYGMTVISPDGCANRDSMIVEVNVVQKLEATTLFSPNGDGRNDTWVINKPALIKGCKLIIFNRNGTEVYSTSNYNNDWEATVNGQKLPEGTYYYVIDCSDGRNYKGPISVIREGR